MHLHHLELLAVKRFSLKVLAPRMTLKKRILMKRWRRMDDDNIGDPATDTFGKDLDLAATTAAVALDAHRYSGIWHLQGA